MGPCVCVCVMVRVLAGVKELGSAAALAPHTGRGPPSHVWKRKRGRRGEEQPGWEGVQVLRRALCLGTPAGILVGQPTGSPAAVPLFLLGHSLTLWVLLEALGLPWPLGSHISSADGPFKLLIVEGLSPWLLTDPSYPALHPCAPGWG